MRTMLVVVTLILIGCGMSLAEDSLQKVRIDKFDGGMNSFDLADVLNGNQGSIMSNAIISKKGIISKRKGQSLFHTDLSDKPLTGIGSYYPDIDSAYMFVASGSEVTKAASDPTIQTWTTINYTWEDTDKLMIHANGVDQDTAFIDASIVPKSITANGNAQLDTAFKKFGSASGLFDGTGDYLTIPDHADWAFGTSDFTIDLWLRFSNVGDDQIIVSQWDDFVGSPFDRAWYLAFVTPSTLRFAYSTDTSNGTNLNFAWTPVINTWYHMAIVRSGNNLYAFINGTQIGSTQDITGVSIANATTALAIGSYKSFGTPSPGYSTFFFGWIDELRIRKDVAAWTSNFTPSTTEYIGSLLQSLTANKDTEFIQANELLFVLNGVDYTAIYNNETWDPGASSTASPPISTTGCWLRNYLFLGGNPYNEDWVYFSNNLQPKLYTATDIIKVNTGDGQKIVRLEPFKLNEVICYKQRSIYDIDITGTTPLDDWTVQPISRSIGLEARRSVVNTGNDHIFLSSYPIAVRTLVRTAYDKLYIDKLSQPIQDIFDGTGSIAINTSYAYKAAGIIYDDKYFLAIPVGNSTVNNYVCVYDFATKGWTTFTGWYPSAWLEFVNNLYYIDANDGRVVQCFASEYGDLTLGPRETVSASEPTVAYSLDYTSPDITFDNPESYKQLDALDLEFSPTEGTANVYISKDLGAWQNVGSVTLTGSGIVRRTLQIQSYGEFKKINIKVKHDGLKERCILQSLTLYGRIKPWRRE